MERGTKPIKDKEQASLFEHVYRNALGNPIIMDEQPTAAQMKANTVVKVKDATDYVFMKFPDGKTVKIPVSEVT